MEQFRVEDGKLLEAIRAVMPNTDPDYQNESYSAQAFLELEFLPETTQSAKRKRRLFTNENLPEIYNLYFIMREKGIRFVYDWLKNDIIPKKKQLFDQEQPELFPLIIFEDPLLSLQRDRENKVLALQNDEGVLTDTRSCSKCNNPQVRIKTIQDRSVDEGASTHFKCPKCSFSWKEG